MFLFYIIILYFIILVLEVPGLVKNRKRKDQLAFSVLFLLSVYLGLAQLYGWPIYNPFSPWIPGMGGG